MAEQYSIQAETLMKAAVEDYNEELKSIKASDANENILKAIRINIQGKPRRLVDIADLKKTENKNKCQLLVFNTDHIELLTVQIEEIGFTYDIEGQFVNIDVPDPSYKQLMEVVDILNRKKNSALSRLTKAKSEATTRARTAVENEFITQAIATAASKKCDFHYDENSEKIETMTMDKTKSILGEEFFNKYKTEELDPFQ
tara:strand:+ start:1341 stop:1940 length:600 start_codon:yes stop_codon:yes gene_type:complete